MNVLDAYVAPFDGEPEDWEDVLRRARRGVPRRRTVLAVAIAVAALVVGPALGVLLTRETGPRLPAAADRARAVVALDPRTGGMLAEAAPWRGHDGVCILFVGRAAGCWHRTPRGTEALDAATAQWGYTFDRRATGADALLRGGRRVPLWFVRFGALGVAVFASTRTIHGDVQAVVVHDAHGRPLYPRALELPAPNG